MKGRLYTDGGARGNPGPSAIGVVLKTATGKTIETISKRIGETTNNSAEYHAIIEGLSIARKHGIDSCSCFLDSELVVRQLNREYKVKDVKLQKLFAQALKIMQEFTSVTFEAIPREKNIDADKLVNEALDRE